MHVNKDKQQWVDSHVVLDRGKRYTRVLGVVGEPEAGYNLRRGMPRGVQLGYLNR